MADDLGDLTTPLPDGLVTATETPTQPDEDLERSQDEARRKFLDTARERFHTVAEVESTLRRAMIEDLEFLQPGNQWDEKIRADRIADYRPCLEVDRLTQPIKQVTNQQRQTRPSIVVSPVDSASDPDTAEVLQGMCRHIEVDSDADVAYDTAGEAQTKTGRGYWQVTTEYESDQSFNQVIKIKRIRNAFAGYLDPSHQEFDGSDANYGFIVEDIPTHDYNIRYGNGKPEKSAEKSLEEFTSSGNENLRFLKLLLSFYTYLSDKYLPVISLQFPLNKRIHPDTSNP